MSYLFQIYNFADHCMVQFVKPNLLGTKKEFLNRFVNPITNGQFDDSTAYDVKLMKKRAHVLHKMLEGSVQRFDYSVLTPFLPPKQEYVIFVRLTDTQVKMYQYYLENLARYRSFHIFIFFYFFTSLEIIVITFILIYIINILSHMLLPVDVPLQVQEEVLFLRIFRRYRGSGRIP